MRSETMQMWALIETNLKPYSSLTLPSVMPDPHPSSPSDEALLPVVIHLRDSNASFGAIKLLHELRIQHPEWVISEKRIRKILQSLTTTTSSRNGEEGDAVANEMGLIADTGVDASINIASIAPKIKVRMFGGEKGKGLVVKEKVQQGEVLWQEDPWVVTADP
jgi:hypothetical protein